MIVLSDGTTSSERHLARLCERTFLRMWSYPNLFTDRGRHGNVGVGKELCDLLVVFANDIIIFSDKSCEFPDSGNLEVDWKRWYRKSVKKSADQVFGAERWIKNFPARIFLDPNCQHPFPFEIPSGSEARFHRVVVASNAIERCRQHHGGSGSLHVAPVQPLSVASGEIPFFIGNVSPDRGFVHVFDEVALEIVLRELDTASDFVAYLGKKEDFILSGKLFAAAGEEDLLATYLVDINDEGVHDFLVPDGYDQVVIDQGHWANILQHPQYIQKRLEDEVSYLWDHVIDFMAGHTMNGTLEEGMQIGLGDHEKLLRTVAAENRLSRRLLAASLRDKIECPDLVPNGPEGHSVRTMFNSQEKDDLAYVLAVVGGGAFNERPDFRQIRREFLREYAILTKQRYPALQRIVGIATDPWFIPDAERSVDMLYYDAEHFTQDDEDLANAFRGDFGLAQRDQLDVVNTEISEYPSLSNDEQE